VLPPVEEHLVLVRRSFGAKENGSQQRDDQVGENPIQKRVHQFPSLEHVSWR